MVQDTNMQQIDETRIERIIRLKKQKDNPTPVGYAGKIYGYIRVSTTMQVDDGESLEVQENRIRDWAMKTYGVDRPIIIRDAGISAKNIQDRPGLVDALTLVKKGDTLIACDITRLSRCTRDVLEIADQCKKDDVKLRFLNPDIDCSSTYGYLILTMLASTGELERKLTSERISTVMQVMSKEGTLKTKAPMGFEWTKGPKGESVLRPCEEEQKVIDMITLLLMKNPEMRLAEIARQLTDRGVTIRKCKQIYANSVGNIVKRYQLRELAREIMAKEEATVKTTEPIRKDSPTRELEIVDD